MKRFYFGLIAIGLILTGCFTPPTYNSLNLEDWLAWKEKLAQINEVDNILQEPELIDERFNGEFWYQFEKSGIPKAILYKFNGTSRGRCGGGDFPEVWGVSTYEIEIKLVDGHLLTRLIPTKNIKGEWNYQKWSDKGIYSFDKKGNMDLVYMDRLSDGKWKKVWCDYYLNKAKDYEIGRDLW